MKRHGHLFETLASFPHLMRCARRAARGKRHRPDVYRFRLRLEANVLDIQQALLEGTWTPSAYREFTVTHPRPRRISAAPFPDRVVHHALVDVLEPIWEPAFIDDSYACRRGLPIGNQTSQFFANVYLDALDQHVRRDLGVRRYLRYVDDLVVLGDNRAALHGLRARIEAFAERLRLRFHPGKCFVAPVGEGLRLLGYRVWPDRVRLPRENVVRAGRRLRQLRQLYARGAIEPERLRASLAAWIGHARHADTWRLRERLLGECAFTRSTA